MFWSVGKEIGSFELYVTKSSDLVFPWKTRCFNLHNTENIFWLVGNEIGFFECYIAKKKRFSFLFAKKRCTHTKNMFMSVFRKYSSSLQIWFSSKRRFFFCMAKWQWFCYFLVAWRSFQHHLTENSLDTAFPFLIAKIWRFQFYCPKRKFCSVY